MSGEMFLYGRLSPFGLAIIRLGDTADCYNKLHSATKTELRALVQQHALKVLGPSVSLCGLPAELRIHGSGMFGASGSRVSDLKSVCTVVYQVIAERPLMPALLRKERSLKCACLGTRLRISSSPHLNIQLTSAGSLSYVYLLCIRGACGSVTRNRPGRTYTVLGGVLTCAATRVISRESLPI